MVIIVRGTDLNNNKSAHVTAMIAAMNAIRRSRKSLIIQFSQKTPIDNLLIGRKQMETEVREVGFMFEDTGVDALFRRVETQRLLKEHFDACCTPILNAENLLDIATLSKKENFESDLIGREEDIEALIRQAKDIYDDVYIYANSKNDKLLDILNNYVDLSITCIRQGIKENITHVPDKNVVVVTGYDNESMYNIRYMRNMYKNKKLVYIPYNVEFKDAYNNGTLMQFLGKNEKISKEDANYPFFEAINNIINTYLENKESVEKELPKLEDIEDVTLQKEIEEDYMQPDVDVIEKKRLFSKKTKKIVKEAEPKKSKSKKKKKKAQKNMKKSKSKKIQDEVLEEDFDFEMEEYEDLDDFDAEPVKTTDKKAYYERPERPDRSPAGADINIPRSKEVIPSRWDAIANKNPDEKADIWVCPECNTKNTKKFCMECGCSKPEPVKEEKEDSGWTCPKCGNVNEPKAKFCMECGTKKPEEPKEWTCPECGNVNEPKAKFCMECGTKK